jgi:hypothetical protein
MTLFKHGRQFTCRHVAHVKSYICIECMTKIVDQTAFIVADVISLKFLTFSDCQTIFNYRHSKILQKYFLTTNLLYYRWVFYL